MAENLPTRTASLDDAGFQKLLKLAQENPALAKEAADELEANPRATLIKLFRLSPSQTAAIANTSDEVLRSRATLLIHRLRSGNFKGITYEPGPAPPGEIGPDISCECHIKISSN
ncbi:hypothetical protein H7849_02640 [Alloacidobacterium dinghuense]|uniref:Uncharacterized protein n=1 Tax=Alloacidobacterium dinghuense TaxID=2763107 RepID=A0A7G8BK39_9BACT|nr:hypothetical protein [Alloacidobacterium dinghuense]QNI32909.1 hypothetical protein H7849_02640 [Alloacidobacterium dinghuense]